MFPAVQRVYNRRAIVRAILRAGLASRADLAKQAGLSQVTSGKIVDELIRDGLIEETPQTREDAPRFGRPGRMLRANTARRPFLAIHLGTAHTHIARVPIGLHRDDLWETQFATPATEQEWRARLKAAWSKYREPGVVAAVVSVPGIVDERSGQVLLAPNLHWLNNVNLIGVVAEETGLRVTLLQDARSLAMGQIAIEQGKVAPADFLLVDFGHGLGAAAAVGGKVYLGPLALNGELGHTPVVGNHRKCGCGATGCIETLVSRGGLLRSFAAATDQKHAKWSDLVAHTHTRGLEPWLREALEHAATAIAAAVNVLGVQRVIITGSVTELASPVLEHLSSAVINGCMWRRFGTMICHGGKRHRLAGLVAAGIDRILLPVEAWE